MRMRALARASFIIVATFALAFAARAQTYPSRPVTLIVPFAAGGPGDTLMRILAERMRLALGQPVIIDNVGGAAGRIGTARLAHAVPDGYTIGHGSAGTHMANGAVYALSYDVLRDFAPIALIAATPQLIIARRTMPANGLKELLAWLKQNPNKALQGTSGVGSYSHLAGVLFQQQTRTSFQFVPYRGTAMNDLVAGHVDLMIDQASNALPQVQSGAIKAYAVAAARRLALAPDIPTVDEAGLPGFHFSHWYALFGPKGTPLSIINKLNAAAVEALDDAAVRDRLTKLGLEIFPAEQRTPAALAAFHNAETVKWWPIIRAASIQAE
jgi:tripartite-type tricarboxylate transporter receptor subunit TctC